MIAEQARSTIARSPPSNRSMYLMPTTKHGSKIYSSFEEVIVVCIKSISDE